MKKIFILLLVLSSLSSDIFSRTAMQSLGIIASKQDTLATRLTQGYNQSFISSAIRSGDFKSILSKKIDGQAWLSALDAIATFINNDEKLEKVYGDAIKLLKSISRDLIRIINNRSGNSELLSINSQLEAQRDTLTQYKASLTDDGYNYMLKSVATILITAGELLGDYAPNSKYMGFPGGLIYILNQAFKQQSIEKIVPTLQNDDLTAKQLERIKAKNIKPQYVLNKDSYNKTKNS